MQNKAAFISGLPDPGNRFGATDEWYVPPQWARIDNGTCPRAVCEQSGNGSWVNTGNINFAINAGVRQGAQLGKVINLVADTASNKFKRLSKINTRYNNYP